LLWGLARSPIDGHLKLCFPSHGALPTLISLHIPKLKSDDFFTKTKKQPFFKIFIHLGPSVHSNGHQNPRLRYHSTNEANRTFVAEKPTRLKMEKMEET
jgi:hypothetical protein